MSFVVFWDTSCHGITQRPPWPSMKIALGSYASRSRLSKTFLPLLRETSRSEEIPPRITPTRNFSILSMLSLFYPSPTEDIRGRLAFFKTALPSGWGWDFMGGTLEIFPGHRATAAERPPENLSER